jgi:hypothetical protein
MYCFDANDGPFVRDTRVLWKVLADSRDSGDLIDGAIERDYGSKRCEDIADLDSYPVGSSEGCIRLHDAVFDWHESLDLLEVIAILGAIVGALIICCCCCACAGAAAGNNSRYERIN